MTGPSGTGYAMTTHPAKVLVKRPRLAAWLLVAASAMQAVSAALSPAAATSWPDRPVNIVVPYAAGGNTDTMARLLATQLSKVLGAPFVINNQGGAMGAIGTSQVIRSAPNGYTLLFASASQIILLPALKKASYDADAGLIPISIFGSGPYILGIRSDLPVKSLQELITYGREHPGKLTYATAGVGGISHLAAALFASASKISMMPVPYKGGAPAAQGVAGGEVDMYFGAASDLQNYAQGGRVRLIGISSKEPTPAYPGLPTIASVLDGFSLSSWNGLFAPAGTPPDIVNRLQAAAQTAPHDKAAVSILNRLGTEPVGGSSQQFRATIAADQAFYSKALKAAELAP